MRAYLAGWASWLRGLTLHILKRNDTLGLVQCLHPQWSSCKFGVRWCFNCGKTITC